jgi:hypothetical protein
LKFNTNCKCNMTIWNSNTHKDFAPPPQGIWQWLVLTPQGPHNSKEKMTSDYKVYFLIIKQHQILWQNQISLPNQWWRSIHCQLNDRHLVTYGNPKKISCATQLVIECFQLPFMEWRKTFGRQQDWQLKVFCYHMNANQKHSIAIGWWLNFFNHYRLNNQKVFQSPQGL